MQVFLSRYHSGESDPLGYDRGWFTERVIDFFDTQHGLSKKFTYTKCFIDSQIVHEFLRLFRDTEFSEAYSPDGRVYLGSAGLYV
ncbi:hypothetical protein KKH43_00240 [Patescibacteria group bacterium]|nr:hypothetical protein [Patescibacteria group bacterium]